MKYSDIKIGDTFEYERTLDAARGSYRTVRGVVVQKKNYNIELDKQGEYDWVYWPHVRHCNPRIVKGAE